MPSMSEKLSNNWISLSLAWERFCDFGERDSNRREQLEEARNAAREASAKDVQMRLAIAANWQKKIQNELVWRIYDGEFDAIGIDITNGVSTPEAQIPRQLFEPTPESFSISWDENRLSVFGRTIVAIRIAPSEALLQRLESTPRVEPGSAVEVSPLAADDFPAEAGATSYESLRAEAILYLFQTYPNFERARLERRIELMVDYIETHHPDVETRWGFDRSSYYATVKRLRSAGHLPSKNVQE